MFFHLSLCLLKQSIYLQKFDCLTFSNLNFENMSVFGHISKLRCKNVAQSNICKYIDCLKRHNELRQKKQPENRSTFGRDMAREMSEPKKALFALRGRGRPALARGWGLWCHATKHKKLTRPFELQKGIEKIWNFGFGLFKQLFS